VRLTESQCFYINLPIGGVAAAIVFLFKIPKAADPVQVPLKEKILQLDLVGTSLMMGLTTSCVLALQYGGQTHPWNSSIVIGLLVGFVAMTVAFVAWEVYQKERAIIVRRLVSRVVSLVRMFTLTNTRPPNAMFSWALPSCSSSAELT
jgi:MFS transporter, DHA2 family, glioxin efflux transporter